MSDTARAVAVALGHPLPAPMTSAEAKRARTQMRQNQRNKTSKTGTTVVHLQRKKGQVVQDCDVYIGRAWNKGGWNLPQSKWANRDRLPNDEYKRRTTLNPTLMASLHELKGKRLGCWCKPRQCHGDALVELVDLYCGDEDPEDVESWWPQGKKPRTETTSPAIIG